MLRYGATQKSDQRATSRRLGVGGEGSSPALVTYQTQKSDQREMRRSFIFSDLSAKQMEIVVFAQRHSGRIAIYGGMNLTKECY